MTRTLKQVAALLLLISGAALYAQIGISMALNRYVYMQHEHIFAKVTLRNDSGRPLLFGKDPALQGFLLFDIRDSANRPIKSKSSADLSITGLMLGPGEIRNVIVQLDRFYNLSEVGKYSVHAYVSHNALKHEYRCKNLFFEIGNGHEVWRRTVGVPDAVSGQKSSRYARERIYSIRQLNEGRESSYYLIVEDASNIYGVTKVGNYIGFEKFHAEVDMLSRIHLLMPIAPRVYHYLAFSIDGTPLTSTYWKTTDTIPILHRDPQSGKVTRLGGGRAIPGRDFVDPKRGKVTISDILKADEKQTPQAPKNRGLVDLGKHAVPRLNNERHE